MKKDVPEFNSPDELLEYARKLEGKQFIHAVEMNLGDLEFTHDYNNARYKGKLGIFLEEQYFGYEPNSDQRPDFAELGIELKTTPFDVLRNGSYSAGERLVLTMIPMDGPVPDEYHESHAWEKGHSILLVHYLRDRTVAPLNQVIYYVNLFTPSEMDMKIIEEDYDVITGLIQAGRADELSEGMTHYLGACTKGSTAATSVTEQYYAPHTPAKKRAFCYKRNYMDAVLQGFIQDKEDRDARIVKDAEVLDGVTFEDLVVGLIDKYVGKIDDELFVLAGIEKGSGKAEYARLAVALLGVKGDNAEEFEKAGIEVKTIRVGKNHTIRESMSFPAFDFRGLLDEEWEDSDLYTRFTETRYFFVVFEENAEGSYVLKGARFWSMPTSDVDGDLKRCWEETRRVIGEGVRLTETPRGYENNLPGMSDNPIAHVRPHATKSAYVFADGTVIGNPDRDGCELPDGRVMTKQSFWLNNSYVYGIIEGLL